jgi:chromosome segregation ATPase
MHRFVWDLTWGSSGGPAVDEESEYRNPSGPKAVPGIYQVRLTVDGRTETQSLKVIMDPRSSATAAELRQQLQLGQQIFAETTEARRAIAEIGSVQKQLAEVDQKLGDKNPTLKSALAEAQSEIAQILAKKETSEKQPAALQEAYTDLASALHVVEGGDRTVPSQAIALYKESSSSVKAGIAQWTTFKQTKLPQLNQKLREASLAPIAASDRNLDN